MKKRLWIILSLVAVLFLVSGIFIYYQQKASADEVITPTGFTISHDYEKEIKLPYKIIAEITAGAPISEATLAYRTKFIGFYGGWSKIPMTESAETGIFVADIQEYESYVPESFWTRYVDYQIIVHDSDLLKGSTKVYTSKVR